MSIVDDKFFVHFAKCGAKELDAASAMVGVELDDGLRGVVLHNVPEATTKACSAQRYVDCFEQIGFAGAVRTNDDSAGHTKFCFVQVVGAKIVELDA